MSSPKDNLIPFTAENAKIKGAAGGKKAAETKRRKKKLKEAMSCILDLPLNEQNKATLKSMGIVEEDEMTNQMLMAAVVFQKAIRGDMRAAEFIRDITGQATPNKYEAARIRVFQQQAKEIKENIELIKAQTGKITGEGESESKDDGFLEALNSSAKDDWKDE